MGWWQVAIVQGPRFKVLAVSLFLDRGSTNKIRHTSAGKDPCHSAQVKQLQADSCDPSAEIRHLDSRAANFLMSAYVSHVFFREPSYVGLPVAEPPSGGDPVGSLFKEAQKQVPSKNDSRPFA